MYENDNEKHVKLRADFHFKKIREIRANTKSEFELLNYISIRERGEK